MKYWKQTEEIATTIGVVVVLLGALALLVIFIYDIMQ